MEYRNLGRILGKIMILEAMLMLAPLFVSFLYGEASIYKLAFTIPIVILVIFGSLLQFLRPKRNNLYQKEGFALTAAVWIVMVIFGAIPFVINGDIPNYADACFEMMSGFTTTGSSVIEDITKVSHSTLFWRSFSHWIGGMGILVFVLIFIPESKDGSSMHLFRAESPGPQVEKIVSKMKVTTKILYLIYFGMTVLEIIILSIGPLTNYNAMCNDLGINMANSYQNDKLFNAFLTAFGCAGTGGFGFMPGSMQYFTPFAQYVVSIFLILFGCNFTLYYLLLIGRIKNLFCSEEFRTYFLIIVSAVCLIFLSLIVKTNGYPQNYTVEESFRHSLFQVSSLMTTAGFTTSDYDMWPMLAKNVLVVIMFIGAMAGSTAGGIKVSRIVILFKGAYYGVLKLINPHLVPKVKFEGKSLGEKTISDVFMFVSLYFLILIIGTFLLSFDGVNGQVINVVSDAGTYEVRHGFFSNFSAVLTCISNVGPAFEAVGPYACFAAYNNFSTIVLTFIMLFGRLEILPVLILFNRRTWKRV